MEGLKHLLPDPKYLGVILIIVFVTSVTVFSVNGSLFDINGNGKPGVVITFDDNYVSDWYAIRDMLKKYDAKVTFMVSGFDDLNTSDIEKLKDLRKDGHEIGCHGLDHVHADCYLANNTIEEYLDAEILSAIGAMNKKGFFPRSFAYPYGSHSSQTDAALLKYFKRLRVTTGSNIDNIKDANEAYYKFNGDRVVASVCIDDSEDITTEEILEGLQRAKEHNETVIFFTHQPINYTVDNSTEKVISYERLEAVLKYAHDNNLTFYRMSDLY
ncbi:hypothetical protein CUJ83_07765 [Methanocella sp. CWC-04]|uniref:NodB homology domain-containing protein n=1 Tax=Methanooceanicella nereidis TaxID=2052831 RepID=A0AAP2RCN9_9EURY|nr:polysaccharide deacetylase family protein [Methanocella sp. CWC-04]MCD1294893.1 hypothetical protein [Methanocella sp. CWC-04]